MRKYKLTLLFFQLLAATVVIIADAKPASFGPSKTESKPIEDAEKEMRSEVDVFPDLIKFAAFLYQ